jgi:hypothetical protein
MKLAQGETRDLRSTFSRRRGLLIKGQKMYSLKHAQGDILAECIVDSMEM